MRLFVPRRLLTKQIQKELAAEGFPVMPTDGRFPFGVRTSAHDAILLSAPRWEGLSYATWLRQWRGAVEAYLLALLPDNSSGTELADCLDAGADVCLTEPLCIDELRAHLRVLRRRDVSAGMYGAEPPFGRPPRRIHDLEIDAAARRVQRAGQPIHLTRREFELLQLLAVHEGEVVSRPTIRKHLYGEDDGNLSNVVDVLVRFLRNKIDKGFATPLVLTCWGQGYLLRGEKAQRVKDAEAPPTSHPLNVGTVRTDAGLSRRSRAGSQTG